MRNEIVADFTLTEWELEVANAVSRGHTRPEVSKILRCSEAKIQRTMKTLARKTEARNVVDLILTLERAGFLDAEREPGRMPTLPELPADAGDAARALHGRLGHVTSVKEFHDVRALYNQALERGW